MFHPLGLPEIASKPPTPKPPGQNLIRQIKMNSRLSNLVINPAVLDQIYEDAGNAVKFLLEGFYKEIVPTNDTWEGQVKFELLYLQQEIEKKSLPVPCHVHGSYNPSTLSYAFVEGLHNRGTLEETSMETILKCIDYGCREVKPDRVGDILRVLDWFVTVFEQSGPIQPGSDDQKLIDDIILIRAKAEKGELPPFDRKKFPGFDYGMAEGLRSDFLNGGNSFILEGYYRIKDCIERRFIPLMPYDIEGDRNIFIYMSLGSFDPLNPDEDLWDLEFVPSIKVS